MWHDTTQNGVASIFPINLCSSVPYVSLYRCSPVAFDQIVKNLSVQILPAKVYSFWMVNGFAFILLLPKWIKTIDLYVITVVFGQKSFFTQNYHNFFNDFSKLYADRLMESKFEECIRVSEGYRLKIKSIFLKKLTKNLIIGKWALFSRNVAWCPWYHLLAKFFSKKMPYRVQRKFLFSHKKWSCHPLIFFKNDNILRCRNYSVFSKYIFLWVKNEKKTWFLMLRNKVLYGNQLFQLASRISDCTPTLAFM